MLENLDTITLDELKDVSLMDRVSFKYMIGKEQITEITKDLRVLEINGSRVGFYKNTYLDTEDDKFFSDSIQKSKNRFKVRYRTYTRTNETFLEIKRKENRITKKNRILVSGDSDLSSFLYNETGFLLSSLTPKLEISYNRLSLTNKNRTERLTIDYDLYFKNLNVGTEANIDIIVLELKQEKDEYSDLRRRLETDFNLQPIKFSKYVFGRILTGEGD